MKRKLTRVTLLMLVTLLLTAQGVQAQTTTGSGVRRSVATIMFAGLAGAVLGLSTLSFYGEPQDHISNIWTGLAVGALAGTGYVVNQQAQRNQTSEYQLPPPMVNRQTFVARNSHPLFRYQWDF